jgi:hypothetical protein
MAHAQSSGEKGEAVVERTAEPEVREANVLFADDFDQGLSEKWELVGLEKSDYRLRDGGLEIRVQPGELIEDTPMLKVVLPFTAADTVVASVRVTLLDEFTEEHEFAGVYLIDESGREFGAKKERVLGQLVYAPGRYEFIGLEGEEGDPDRYDIRYTIATDEAGPLRILVDRGYAYVQVGPSVEGKYQNHFHCAIREESKQRGFALTAAGAPEGVEHWVRFDDFRVFRR